jgi:dihydrofolate synthase/folylpolyglutamate synthase
MRVDGRLITNAELLRLTARLKPEVEAVNLTATYGRLTTFEVLTALGFMFFAAKKTDFNVVEVGLGGRLDATNVVKPEVSVITTLGLDHTDVLGDTLAKIAAEKAGIIKPGVPVVSARLGHEASGVVEAFSRRNGSSLIRVGREITFTAETGADGVQSMDIKGRLGVYKIDLSLRGRFQQENAAAAVAALEVLAEKGYKITPETISEGIKNVRWPGRFQLVRRRPAVVVDGAHNPQAARELRLAVEDFLADRNPGRKILIIGMSSDKDYALVASELAPLFDSVIVTRSRHPRALAPEVLAEEFTGLGCEVIATASVADALNLAVEAAQSNGFVCATGSLFIVGEALEWAHLPGF